MAATVDIGDLRKRFHSPKVDDELAKKDLVWLEVVFTSVAENLCKVIPDGREKSLVLTKLEEAKFWAAAGISRQFHRE
jgi:hypothetical protein